MPSSSRTYIIGLPLLLLLALASALALTLMTAKPLIAQTVPHHSDPNRKARPEGTRQHHWQAFYWNNTDLAGTPILQRSEPSLSHEWGRGSPDIRVKADHFSARWARYIETTPG